MTCVHHELFLLSLMDDNNRAVCLLPPIPAWKNCWKKEELTSVFEAACDQSRERF